MRKHIYLAALMAAIASSCAQSDKPLSPMEEQAQAQQSKQSVTISLSGTFGDPEGDALRAYMIPTDKDEIKISFDESELMLDGAVDPATGKPTRVKNTNTAQLTLYFVEKSNPSNVQTVIVAPTDFRKNADGTYTIEFIGTVALSGSFDTGEWYVSGGYRLQSSENLAAVGSTYVSDDGKIQAANGTKDFKIPFVFGWTRLTTKSDNSALSSNHAQQLSLKFKPDGYMLRYRVINNLVEDIKLGVVCLFSQNLSLAAGGHGYTNPSTSNLTEENVPYISTPIGIGNSIRNAVVGFGPAAQSGGWGEGRILAPGEYVTNYIRFNNPGNPTTEGTSFMRFQFGTLYFPQGETAGGAKLDARDIVELPTPSIPEYYGNNKLYPYKPSGYITDVWRGASYQEYGGYQGDAVTQTLGYRNMFLPKDKIFDKKGTVNNINYKVNSDLMITELYTTKYSERGGSYGLIEIYNPTLDPIDISKYGLMRLGYRSDNGAYKVRNLPSATETAVGADVGIALFPVLEKALVLPLDLRSGEPSGDWAINSFNRPMHQSLETLKKYSYAQAIQYDGYVGSGTKYSGFAASVVDFSSKNYITGLSPITPGATYIQPGKTMIILFGAYASASYQANDADRALFARIQQAVNAGYCDHVVAIAHGDASAQPHEARAGVTTADLGDAFSLVRIAKVPDFVRFGYIGAGNENPENKETNVYSRVTTRIFVDGTWNSRSFDGQSVIKGLMDAGARALIRRPYGPYLWNTGFQAPDDPSRYYQQAYSIDKATFGAPYFSSYDSGKSWREVVQPRINQRNANLFKKASQ